MSLHTLDEIEHAINDLTPADRDLLLLRFAASEMDEFEQQVAKDAEAGRLDGLMQEALEEHRAGRTRPL